MSSITFNSDNKDLILWPRINSEIARLESEGISVFSVSVKPISKSRAQEQKYHAIMSDIHRTGHAGGTQLSAMMDVETFKALMLGRFDSYRRAIGQPLRWPSKHVYDWENGQVVTVRPSSKKFNIAEANDFIDFLMSEGKKYEAEYNH